jgi:hypothetical protein
MAPDEIRSERTPESADRETNTDTIPETASEPSEPIVKKPFLRSIAEGFRSWTEQRRRQPEQQVRAGKALDRSKTFLALAVAVVVMLFVFLGMFSSSTSRTADGTANKTKPNLGRPEAPSNRTAEGHGSVTGTPR